MNFKEQIIELEQDITSDIYLLKEGIVPIVITAVHTMPQKRANGRFKLNEPFTKAITKYVSNQVGASYFIKIKDNGIETNCAPMDEFKHKLLNYVKDNNIKLVLDIHGAKKERAYDVEVGTLNHLSAKEETIASLVNSFKKNNILNIVHNESFKGGGITKTIYGNTNTEVIQMEINKKYRNLDDIDNMKKICDALIEFINIYNNK